MKSNLVDIEVKLHHQTDRAVLVSTTGDRKDAVWVPKSLCEIEPKTAQGLYTLTAEEGTLIDKELV